MRAPDSADRPPRRSTSSAPGLFIALPLACVHVSAADKYRHEPVAAGDEVVVVHAPRLASESLKRGLLEICRNHDLREKTVSLHEH
jgi:hypothetical protein